MTATPSSSRGARGARIYFTLVRRTKLYFYGRIMLFVLCGSVFRPGCGVEDSRDACTCFVYQCDCRQKKKRFQKIRTKSFFFFFFLYTRFINILGYVNKSPERRRRINNIIFHRHSRRLNFGRITETFKIYRFGLENSSKTENGPHS